MSYIRNVHFKQIFILSLFIHFLTNGSIFAQSSYTEVKVVRFKWYESLRNQQNDTTYIVNFWATWCAPCVAELSNFELLTSQYKTKKVKVYLVSLDFVKNIHNQLRPFVKKKKLQSAVVLMNEPNANAWIDKVSPSWSGSLPATIIFNNSTSLTSFLEKELNFTILDSITSKFISK